MELKGKGGKSKYSSLQFSETQYMVNQLILDTKASTFHFVKAKGKEKAGQLVKG